MRKINYKLLFVSSFVCLYLAFNDSPVFGQCGYPGTPRCGVIEKPKKKQRKPGNKTSKSSNNPSTSKAIICKSDNSFRAESAGQSLFVICKETKEELVFVMEALDYFSDEKTGEIRMYVDLNRNSKIDISDIRYKIVRNIKDYELKSNYLSGEDFSSIALVGYSFTSTKNQSRPHPIWSLKIPKTEILFKLEEINIRFEYWSETCPKCIVRIPEYIDISNIRDANGLLDFGPVKKIKFNP